MVEKEKTGQILEIFKRGNRHDLGVDLTRRKVAVLRMIHGLHN